MGNISIFNLKILVIYEGPITTPAALLAVVPATKCCINRSSFDLLNLLLRMYIR